MKPATEVTTAERILEMRYNSMKMFKTGDEACAFAQQVGSDSWGFLFDGHDQRDFRITGWYVDYNDPDWEGVGC